MSKEPDYVKNIRDSGISIYDPIEIGDVKLWIPASALEKILGQDLIGLSLKGLPLRTRSKVVKEHVCKALGYPIPTSFKKSQPRFLGQLFDTYIQKSNNLQVWNEELSSTRRYVIIKVSQEDIIQNVKVVTGDTLSLLDTTGTLTQKYQARLVLGDSPTELITNSDTAALVKFVRDSVDASTLQSPVRYPQADELLSITAIFSKLEKLVGTSFPNAGFDQERNRGAALHKLVCQHLGYKNYSDDGQFPDLRHQLLEVKLQTSPTIDLGLVCPNSLEPLDTPQIMDYQVRHCDVRYALFYAKLVQGNVLLTNFYLTTGNMFFGRFPQFGGKVLNKKLQIPLPHDFFDKSEGSPN